MPAQTTSMSRHQSDADRLDQLRVTLVQTALEWHNPNANRTQIAKKIAACKHNTDLVVLPEMFTSGFTAHPEKAGLGSQTSDWLLAQADYLGAAVTGSIACRLDDGASNSLVNTTPYVNRLLFATPAGELFHYDKVHLFRMAGEHERYQAGRERHVIEYQGWRLLLTVCYDLRFPVFCRNRNDYDLLCCVANWPEARRQHWRTLLEARAIENQAYVIGVNRVGKDGKGLAYAGDSMAIDYQGNKLVDQADEWVETVTLSREALQDYRQQFPAWQDADEFSLSLKPN